MNILSWNIRGMNEPLKQAELYDWNLIENYEFSNLGKIWIIYNKTRIKVLKIDSSDQFVHCKVEYDNNEFEWTIIYGANQLMDRQILWHKLVQMSSRITSPWMIQGDFNAVMGENDRCVGNELDSNHASELKDCINNSGLLDDRRIWRRLDRAFVNEDWCVKFQNSFFEAGPSGISDHSPIIVVIQNNEIRRKGSFMYFNFWADHPDYKSIIEEEWNKEYRGYTMYKIVKKLKAISFRLKNLNKQQYSDISQRVSNQRVLLEKLQNDIQNDPLNNHLSEESFYKQKSRIQWLQLGDSNTKYFHNSIKQRRVRNSIPVLKLDSGEQITKKEDIHKEITRYYTNMFSKSNSNRRHIDRRVISQGTRVSEEENRLLMRSISEKEVKSAVFSIGSDKAAGPDGYNSFFFKKS
ncbi:uncharacterized protein LOC126665939 [Mercurialis annua]|uniref:uncharacterized protein LOC126665939 n=1 Tax=Mercurialis annua TaxID=3986 RepID=UPI00215F001D|nr:uncharacterized protein LOC126665939 [Mercurialis annua]